MLEAFTEGFRLQYAAKNLVSAEIHKSETLANLQLGRMLGPFVNKPIPTLRISPIGIVEKPDKGWCLISHLSFPTGSGIHTRGLLSCKTFII